MDGKLATRLERRVVNVGIVEKGEDDLCCVARCNRARTLERPNTEPLGMTGDDKVRSVTLGEWAVPAAVALGPHDKPNVNAGRRIGCCGCSHG